MTIRYRQDFTEKIIEVDYLEVEGPGSVEAHAIRPFDVSDSKWIFKEEKAVQ